MDLSPHAVLPLAIGALIGAIAVAVLRRPKPPELESPQRKVGEIEVARLRSELARSDARYQRQIEFFINFPELVKALTAAMSYDQVTATCSRGISALLQTHCVAIWLAKSPTQLQLVDGAGFAPQLRGELLCTIAELGVRPLLSQRAVLPYDQPVNSVLRRHGIATDLAVPIWHGDRLFGLIMIAGASGEPAVVHRTLAMIADLAGVALLGAMQISKIRQEAENDALTGLPNRRTLFRQVASELSRCHSYGTHLSLAMIDVDNFKHFNDTNGHQAGDEALRLVAKLIRSVTRRTDLVARYGGEEFTVLLLGADPIQAQQHAERIRRTIAEAVFPHGDKQPKGYVSISVGLATAPTDAQTRETLFEAADQALYLAKQRGRDRVIAWEGSTHEAEFTPSSSNPMTSGEIPIDEELFEDGTRPENAIVRAIALGK